MDELRYELCNQQSDCEDNWHFDTALLTPADFLREGEGSFNSKQVRDEATNHLKVKFDYVRDIMNDESAPRVQRMVERFLKSGGRKKA